MGMMRDAARSTRGRIVIGAIIALVVWKIGLVLVAPSKVMPGFTPNARGQVNVLVTLTARRSGFTCWPSSSMAACPARRTNRSKCVASTWRT